MYIGVIFCLVVKCAVVLYVYWCDLLFSSKICCGCLCIWVCFCVVVKCVVVVYVYWCDLLFSSKMCCGCLCILV